MDLEISIDRAWKKKGYTISRVFVNGKRFGDGKKYCNALEDEDRGLTSDMSVDEILAVKNKHKGQTAIPRGRYKVTITYSPRFKKDMPLLNAVKGFTGIRLHPLNNADGSEGCIGFGVNDKVGWISNSRYWTTLLCSHIKTALDNREDVFIKIG